MFSEATKIEDLIEAHPSAVGFFIGEGLPCVVCGEPFWGSVGDLARQKNWSDEQIGSLVSRLNEIFAP